MSPAQAMTMRDEIRDLEARVAKAQSDTHTWQVAGDLERYLEAYDDAEALELQLAEKIRQGGAASGKGDAVARATEQPWRHESGDRR